MSSFSSKDLAQPPVGIFLQISEILKWTKLMVTCPEDVVPIQGASSGLGATVGASGETATN